jgi:hypothetical protein
MGDSFDLEFPEFSAAAVKLSGAISSIEDVRLFLSARDITKSNATRFVCWMISFGFLSPSEVAWARQLFSLYEDYRCRLGTLTDLQNPITDIVSESESRLIQVDVFRGIHWFERHAIDLRLSPFLISHASLRMTRVLVLLSLNFESLSYTQSYDRYSYITFLLTLDFCAQTGLPSVFAEAMSFFLTHEFLVLVDIPRMLENPMQTELHFHEIDEKLVVYAPAVILPMRAAGQGSVHFALRWEMLLFAHEHRIRPLLLIWDQILVNRRRFREYLLALVFAHVRQIPPVRGDEIVVEKLQKFKDWDVGRLIDDSEMFVRKEYQIKCPTQRMVLIAIVIALVVLFLGCAFS